MNAAREECLAEIHRLLAEQAGLDLESLGRRSIAHAIDRRMERLGLESPRDFLDLLRADPSRFRQWLDDIVVLETWFFRDPQALDCLRSEAAKWRATGDHVYRVLSAACSTGEEPYSMAMALREAGLGPEQFRVVGADVSDRALGTAREAVYAPRSFRELAPPYRALCDRWCEPAEGMRRVRADIRSAVEFRWGNLARADFLAGEPPFQAVFCRNVLIYFHAEARRVALSNLLRLTCPGGLVCCAPAEARILSEAGLASLGSACPFAFRYEGSPAATTRPASVARPTRPVEPCPATPSAPAKLRRPDRSPAQPASRVRGALSRATSGAGPAAPSVESADEPEPSVLQRARRAADLGQLEHAQALCDRMLAQNPASAEAHYLRGVIRQSQGAVVEARQWFEKTVYLDPKHYQALVHLMLLAEQGGDLAQAANYRRRAEDIASAEVSG